MPLSKKTNLVTKDDLKKAIKNLATKDDLFSVKEEIRSVKEDLEAQIKSLPTREEYFKSTDQIMGQLKNIQEEQIILADMKRQVNEPEGRHE